MKKVMQRLRLTEAEKLAIVKASAKAKITESALIRLAVFSRHHVRSKSAQLRAESENRDDYGRPT